MSLRLSYLHLLYVVFTSEKCFSVTTPNPQRSELRNANIPILLRCFYFHFIAVWKLTEKVCFLLGYVQVSKKHHLKTRIGFGPHVGWKARTVDMEPLLLVYFTHLDFKEARPWRQWEFQKAFGLMNSSARALQFWVQFDNYNSNNPQ